MTASYSLSPSGPALAVAAARVGSDILPVPFTGIVIRFRAARGSPFVQRDVAPAIVADAGRIHPARRKQRWGTPLLGVLPCRSWLVWTHALQVQGGIAVRESGHSRRALVAATAALAAAPGTTARIGKRGKNKKKK